jgi:hypothetical protein
MHALSHTCMCAHTHTRTHRYTHQHSRCLLIKDKSPTWRKPLQKQIPEKGLVPNICKELLKVNTQLKNGFRVIHSSPRLVMAKCLVQAYWNSCGWDSAFSSQSSVLALSSCGFRVASPRHLWSVQSSWCWREDCLASCLVDSSPLKAAGPPGKGLTAVN